MTMIKETLITEHDIYLFKEGSHFDLYEKLGAHPDPFDDGRKGTFFAVWAPNAVKVSVIGDFNGWDKVANPMVPRDDGSGIWEAFIQNAGDGDCYKYHICSAYEGYEVDKSDPVAFFTQKPPLTASVIRKLDYSWQDSAWMKERKDRNSLSAPFNVYEFHPGSWRRKENEDNRYLTYRELAEELPEYLHKMGFTHVEFMPVMEHPFYGSWGYQTTGYFAPTSRYGSPEDLMFLVDCLHQKGIGVILDWVPSHFPSDEYGLVYFDGSHLYEHADPKKGFHPDWKSCIFNYGRKEVVDFLISSALFWLDRYHADGLRIDAVASMLYLDYSREEGEWIPNEYGGRENLEAISFLRRMNEAVYSRFPDVQTIAEESTAWPMVTRPTSVGGLGFGMKWNMGWMHDILDYMSKDPVYRKYNHDKLTFSLLYAFNENFMLSISHDEVVYGKGSLLNKMPGDDWQKRANLRLLLGFMYGHPGKNLLFMGSEFGQRSEWDHERGLEWYLLDSAEHKGLLEWTRELNILASSNPQLYEKDFVPEGFRWVDCSDSEQSIISFLRKGSEPNSWILGVCNFTPIPRHNYRIGVPQAGFWKELLNSDGKEYGGSGQGNLGGTDTVPVPYHGMNQSIVVTLPPLAIVFFSGQQGQENEN
jgi:1,4-alpha-glucan branching enzyme